MAEYCSIYFFLNETISEDSVASQSHKAVVFTCKSVQSVACVGAIHKE